MNYEEEIDSLKKKINNLEMNNESLTNRIRMLEEDFERLKKAQLDKYFEYSSEYETTEDEGEICCCKSLPPQQPCPEIEDYLNSIKMVE